MPTCYVFADPDGSRLGVGIYNPPVTGGQVIDMFEDDEGSPHERRLAIAEQRNSPMRLERSGQRFPERYPANRDGYLDARLLAAALHNVAPTAPVQLVTSRGVAVPLRRTDHFIPFVPPPGAEEVPPPSPPSEEGGYMAPPCSMRCRRGLPGLPARTVA